MPTGDTSHAPTAYEDLVDHLARHSALGRRDAVRLIQEVLLFFDELPEAFVKRRHSELQAQGLANLEAFRQIADELRQRRFAAPALTERQIRRIIYG